MPHTEGKDKISLNSMVLAEMESGKDPQTAIDYVLNQYPNADAGFLAASVNGRMGIGNCKPVLARGDKGMAILNVKSRTVKIATIHNAIQPHSLISTLSNQVGKDKMCHQGGPEHWITIKSGITVKSGTTAQVHVDSSRMVKNIVIQNNLFLNDSCAVGLGDIVEVLSHGVRLGWLGYEPFMTLLNGQVVEIDGYKEIKLPVLSQHPYL